MEFKKQREFHSFDNNQEAVNFLLTKIIKYKKDKPYDLKEIIIEGKSVQFSIISF